MRKQILLMGILILLAGTIFTGVQGIQTELKAVVLSNNINISFIIAPLSIDFGEVYSGQQNIPEKTDQKITIQAGKNNNINFKVDVSVDSEPFKDGLYFDDGSEKRLANGAFYNLVCTPVNGICGYNSFSITPTLNLPLAISAGTRTGNINYLITGPTP